MEALQPKLRFPGFKGDWEEKKLLDVSSKSKYGLNASAKEYDGENGYIRITDIDEQSRTFLRAKITSPSDFDDDYLLTENDLLFTRTGASTGKTYLYDRKDGKLYFAGFLIKFNINNANSRFVFYHTLQSTYDKWVGVMSMRSGQPGINAEEYSSLPIIVPSIDEQTKIATFLTAVDEKLNLLKEKKALLEAYKKGMMQKLFTQEVRFKDDNGEDFEDWEEKRLKELVKIYDGTHQTPTYVENGIPFYSVEHITANQFEKTKFISEDVFNKENLRVKLEKGDILMTRIGSIGVARLIDWDVKASFYVSLALLKKSNKISNNYLVHFINSAFFQNELWERTIHVAFPQKINLGEIGDCLVLFPNEKEQTKIADFITAVDKKIEMVNDQIDHTQEYKKGLLQQMFV